MGESDKHTNSPKTLAKRPGCRQSGVRLIHFYFTNFNISSIFGIKDTLLSCNPSGLNSQTPRPGAVEYLAPDVQYQPIEWKKRKGNEWRRRGRKQLIQQKGICLAIEPVSPTPSNTESPRLFQRDTDRRIKVLWNCEVLLRGGSYEYQCAITALRVTRTGTSGVGGAP